MIRLKRLYANDFKQLREVEMTFPDAGRILVQGKNEAGKSTLFEAVFFSLFGQALATELGARNLEDLIGYEKESARVELDLTVRDRLFKITRTLKRGRANVYELDIVHSDGTIEEIRGNVLVNKRIVSELGFNGDALLNTCFVEQKRLDKLEGMTKAKREESLATLLNLERLQDLEERLKLRGEDEKMLTRLEHRVELAQAQQELPAVEEDLNQARAQLSLLELRAYLRTATQELQASQESAAQLDSMRARRAALIVALSRVDALDKVRAGMDNTLNRYDAASQDADRISAIEKELAETRLAVSEHLPALNKRAAELAALGKEVGRITRVEGIRGNANLELQRAQSIQQELNTLLERGNTLNETVTQNETRGAALDTKLRDYEIGEALGAWALARAETGSRATDESKLHAVIDTRGRLNKQQRSNLILLCALFVGVGVLGVLLLPGVSITTRNLALPLLIGIVLAVLAGLGAMVLLRRYLRTSNEITRLTEQIGKMRGEDAARLTLANSSATRAEAAEANLKALGVPTSLSVEAAQARRLEIAASMENKTRDELTAARDESRQNSNYARAQREEVVKRINELELAGSADKMAPCERVIEKSERIMGQWRPILARRAATLEVPAETEALRDAYRGVQGDIKAWNVRVQQVERSEAELSQVQRRLAASKDELESQYNNAEALLNGTVPKWNNSLPRSAYVSLQELLAVAFVAEGGAQVRAEMHQLENKYGAAERDSKLRHQRAMEAVTAANGIMTELGIEDTLNDEPTIEELNAFSLRFDRANLEEKPQLAARVANLQQRVGELNGTRNRLERELGLVGETIDGRRARAELEEERRAQRQRQYGTQIVQTTRKRIMQRILPATMDYMRRILPQLTRDRYHDAELDAETYKIKVWDERAGQSGAWKEKNIFSGGTKDQFSLALRLAFALATLPQERGVSPGFIFLDEPLGSFDSERVAALLYLLTEGEIGRAFDQIFLISHVPVQEHKFTHKLRLENGTIVESTLAEISSTPQDGDT